MVLLSDINASRTAAGVGTTNIEYNSRNAEANADVQDLASQQDYIMQQRQTLLEQHSAGTISTEEYNRQNSILTSQAHDINSSTLSSQNRLTEATATYKNAAAGNATSVNRNGAISSVSGPGVIEQRARSRIGGRNNSGVSLTGKAAENQYQTSKKSAMATMSGTGLGWGVDPASALRGSQLSTGEANKKAAEDARINNIKGYDEIPVYDDQGNITGYEQRENQGKTQQMQNDARKASDEKSAADANYAASLNADSKEGSTPGASGASDLSGLPGTNPESFLNGLSDLEQQYAGTSIAPLFDFYKSQYADLTAKGLRGEELITQLNAKTDEYVAQQESDMHNMQSGWEKLYQNIEDSSLASAERTRDHDARLAQQQKEADQLAYERGIRDQNIKNEEDRQMLLLNNGVSGGWRSSMHTARMIDVMKKGERLISDLGEDKINNSDKWANTMIDIEQNYHANVTSAYDQHNVSLLGLADKLSARAAEIDKTVYSNDVNKLEAINKITDDWYTGVSKIAENTTNTVVGYLKEVSDAAAKASTQMSNDQNKVWDDVVNLSKLEGDGKGMLWAALTAKAKTLGIPLPASAPSLMSTDQAIKAQLGNLAASMVGQDRYTQDGTDYGYLLAQSYSASKWSGDDVTRGLQLGQAEMNQGNFRTVADKIISNVELGFSGDKDKEVRDESDLIREIGLSRGQLSPVDGQYGGLWKQFEESGKIFADMSKEPLYANMQAHIQDVLGGFLHGRYGGALTANEMQKAEPYFVQQSDNAETIKWKMNQMYGVVLRAKAQRYDDVLGNGSWAKLTGTTIPELDYSGVEDKPSPSVPGTTDDKVKSVLERFNIPLPKGGDEVSSIGGYFSGLGHVTQEFDTPIADTEHGGLYQPSTVAAWGGVHAGIDIAMNEGTDISVPFEGEVIDAGTQKGWGGTVVIRDANGAEHRFSHLKEVDVKKGDKITSGTSIAKSGGAKGADYSGTSTGPHLDYRIRKDGKYIDPNTYHV